MNTEHRTTEGEIKEIWERLTAGEASIKSAHKRIDSLEKLADSVHQLASSTNQLAIETKALREDYENADERLEELEHKPLKKLDVIINSGLTALGGGIVGYLLGYILQ